MADAPDRNPTLSLAYGLRLLPASELDRVDDARWRAADGSEGRITMHLIEGDIETIKARLHESIDAFFEFVAPLSAGGSERADG